MEKSILYITKGIRLARTFCNLNHPFEYCPSTIEWFKTVRVTFVPSPLPPPYRIARYPNIFVTFGERSGVLFSLKIKAKIEQRRGGNSARFDRRNPLSPAIFLTIYPRAQTVMYARPLPRRR